MVVAFSAESDMQQFFVEYPTDLQTRILDEFSDIIDLKQALTVGNPDILKFLRKALKVHRESLSAQQRYSLYQANDPNDKLQAHLAREVRIEGLKNEVKGLVNTTFRQSFLYLHDGMGR